MLGVHLLRSQNVSEQCGLASIVSAIEDIKVWILEESKYHVFRM